MKVNIGPYGDGTDGHTDVSIVIEDEDMWSMDTTLALIILPMLEKFKLEKVGGPNVDLEDVPADLQPTEAEIEAYKTDGTVDEKFFDRWDYVLDAMIFSFKNIQEDWEAQFHSGNIDMKLVPIPGSRHFEMKKGPKDTHRFDKDGWIAMNERISFGFRMFGKYYRSLWT